MFGSATTRLQRYRRRHPVRSADAAAPPSERTSTLPPVTVSLSPRLAGRAGELDDALGAGYQVTIAPDDDAAVVVVPAQPPATISECRRRQPTRHVVVFEPGPAADPITVARCIDAGADGFITQPSMQLLAAHIRSIVRRPTHEACGAPDRRVADSPRIPTRNQAQPPASLGRPAAGTKRVNA